MSGSLEYSQSYYGHPSRALPQIVPVAKRTIGASIAQPKPEIKNYRIDPRHQAVKPNSCQKLEKRVTAIESEMQKTERALQDVCEKLETMYIQILFQGVICRLISQQVTVAHKQRLNSHGVFAANQIKSRNRTQFF